MRHFADNDYDIDRAIAAHNGLPYIAKKCECWDGYKRVPGTKPCAPGSCEKCDSHSKKSSQGDKPSPKAAQDVLHAIENGNEDEAKSLLGQTDCPKGCEVHAEGKCNHGFMSAGRTRVRYLLNDSSFDKQDKNFDTVDHDVKESSAMDDLGGFARGDHQDIRCPECGADAESWYNYNTEMYEADCPNCGVHEMFEDPNDFRR
jgi:hypothetical protein